MKETMYVVIPCYNEEQMLPITAEALIKKLDELKAEGRIAQNSKVMFVDDGSKDKTWEIIQKLHEASPVFTGLKLSRNKGHQNALLAGLMTARNYADIVVSMDADLQDDINAIDGFLDKRADGCDIVYGVRSSREKDTAFKRGTAQAYYKLLEHMGVEITYNHADYRLMSKRAIDALAEFKEVNLFLRGLVPMVGFKSDIVKYVRNERVAGESKYPLKKMLSFAVEGITYKIYHHYRYNSIFSITYNAYIFPYNMGSGAHCSGLGFNYHVYMGDRRTSAFGYRHYRRIYRQDLFGNKG